MDNETPHDEGAQGPAEQRDDETIAARLSEAGERLRSTSVTPDGSKLWDTGDRSASAPTSSEGSNVVELESAVRAARRSRWLSRVAAVIAVGSMGVAATAVATSRPSDDASTNSTAQIGTAQTGTGQTGTGQTGTGQTGTGQTGTAGIASPAAMALVSKLNAAPVDPSKVKLVSTVSNFDTCSALLDNLHQVGAAHVGSRGFNAPIFGPMYGDVARSKATTFDASTAGADTATAAAPDTVGTNIQVAGVDEPDSAKAIGTTVYDLRNNRFRIIDTTNSKVLGKLVLDGGDNKLRQANVFSLLVHNDRAVIFGSESVQSEPIESDPSASTSSHQFVTISLVDITNPASPKLTDRVRIDGTLVSARLVDGEVRMVLGSYLNNIGFVMPTSPESIPKALQTNRLSVADSSIADWIPSVRRGDEPAEPLIPCDRVHVPDTFAGVSMTSMVKFGADAKFAATATGLLAPSDAVYATKDTVTIAASIWVDPAVANTLEFPSWDSAIHQFTFSGEAPGYKGSAVVPGAINGQFAFGEVGPNLAVVSTAGTPWNVGDGARVNLTLYSQAATPTKVGSLEDIGSGGTVTGVRFTATRGLVSTSRPEANGSIDTLRVIDLSAPGSPRSAGTIDLDVSSSYIHPKSDTEVLALGTYFVPVDQASADKGVVPDSGTRLVLVDTANADGPSIKGTWSQRNSNTEAAADHHAFLWWPKQNLVGFGLNRWEPNSQLPPVAAIIRAAGTVEQVGLATPTEVNVSAPCPALSKAEIEKAGAAQAIGDATILRCAERPEGGIVEWPGYSCYEVSADQLKQYGTDPSAEGTIHVCNKMGPPSVSRVMIVDGKMWLNTNESFERINPQTMASEQVIPIG